MIDKDTHDNWKLDNGDDGKHHCDDCGEQVNRESDLSETTGCRDIQYICNICAERYDLCQRCDRPTISSEYCHDEYCDSCCDILADKSLED